MSASAKKKPRPPHAKDGRRRKTRSPAYAKADKENAAVRREVDFGARTFARYVTHELVRAFGRKEAKRIAHALRPAWIGHPFRNGQIDRFQDAVWRAMYDATRRIEALVRAHWPAEFERHQVERWGPRSWAEHKARLARTGRAA